MYPDGDGGVPDVTRAECNESVTRACRLSQFRRAAAARGPCRRRARIAPFFESRRCLLDRLRPKQFQPAPSTAPPPRASARSISSRVIGTERTSAPVASRIAFAIAAAVGMIGGSPRPFEPRFVRWASGSSTNSQTISGTSAIVGSLYASSVCVSTVPGGRVEQPLLRQRVPDRLDDPALDLAARVQRVDDPADVVDRGDALDAHLARLDVDRDLRDLDAEGEHAHAGRVRPASARAEDLRVLEQPEQVLARPGAAVGADDPAALQRERLAAPCSSAARRARGSCRARRRPPSEPQAPSTESSTSRPRATRTGRGRSRRARRAPGRAAGRAPRPRSAPSRCASPCRCPASP